MARTSKISQVKKTLKDSVSTTQGAVGQVVGKARETIESVAPLIPGRGPGPSKKVAAPAPEPLVQQMGPRKVHGDALVAPAKKTTSKKTTAKRTVAKKTAAKKTPAKTAAKKTPAKKTPAKKTAAKKTPAKKTPATSAKKTAAKKTPATAAKKAPAKKR